MFISRQLKAKNIAEYLLYMWQIEDLIRANKLDIESIVKNVVEPYGLDPEGRRLLIGWYEELIDMIEQLILSGNVP